MAFSKDCIYVIYVCAGFLIGSTTSQACTNTNYTLFTAPWAEPANPSVVSSTDCRSACVNDPSCFGWTDAGSGSCRLNRNASIVVSSTSSSNYNGVIRGTNPCNSTANCLYSWDGRNDTHGFYGSKNAATTLNDCLKSCHTNTSCVAVDWNTDNNECYTFSSRPDPFGQPKVYQFQKICTSVAPSSTTIPPSSNSSSSASSASSSSVSTVAAASSYSPVSFVSTGITPSPSNTSANSTSSVSTSTTTTTSTSTTTKSYYNGSEPDYSGSDDASYPLAIKPAYIVLAGLGGGCLLLMLTAVITLCAYPMNRDETYSTKGTYVDGGNASQEIAMEQEGDDNVEVNPYYNRSEIDAPDFTKEENIM